MSICLIASCTGCGKFKSMEQRSYQGFRRWALPYVNFEVFMAVVVKIVVVWVVTPCSFLCGVWTPWRKASYFLLNIIPLLGPWMGRKGCSNFPSVGAVKRVIISPVLKCRFPTRERYLWWLLFIYDTVLFSSWKHRIPGKVSVLPIVSSLFLNLCASTLEKEAACSPEMSVSTASQPRRPQS